MLRWAYWPQAPEDVAKFDALSEAEKKAMLPLLVEALKTRHRCIQALSKMGALALEEMLQLLDNPDPSLRNTSALMLTAMGEPAKVAIPIFLAKARDDPDPSVQHSCATALATLGLRDTGDIPAALEVFNSKKAHLVIKVTMARALASLGPEAMPTIPTLLQLFQEKDLGSEKGLLEAMEKILLRPVKNREQVTTKAYIQAESMGRAPDYRQLVNWPIGAIHAIQFHSRAIPLAQDEATVLKLSALFPKAFSRDRIFIGPAAPFEGVLYRVAVFPSQLRDEAMLTVWRHAPGKREGLDRVDSVWWSMKVCCRRIRDGGLFTTPFEISVRREA